MNPNDDGELGEDPAIAAAYAALNAGDPETALNEAANASDEEERLLVEIRALIDLGMLDAARDLLDLARERFGEFRVDVVELEGEIELESWELEAAGIAFDAIADVEPDPWIWERRALLADHAGEHDRSHELMVEAAKLDPERPTPVRVSFAEFDAIVEGALATLKPEFANRLVNVRIVREPVPFRELVDPNEITATPPDILGLFVGPTIHDLSEDVSGELPPTIYLFQRNLERMVGSTEELAEEIRVTLFHEIGHLLGLDEDEVASMGLA